MVARLTFATIAASLACVIAYSFAVMLEAATLFNVPENIGTFDRISHLLFFFLLFGWPIALIVTTAVGIPGYHYLRHRNKICFVHIVLAASATGAVVIPLCMTFLSVPYHPELLDILWLCGQGIWVGIVGGTVFWAAIRGAGSGHGSRPRARGRRGGASANRSFDPRLS